MLMVVLCNSSSFPFAQHTRTVIMDSATAAVLINLPIFKISYKSKYRKSN